MAVIFADDGGGPGGVLSEGDFSEVLPGGDFRNLHHGGELGVEEVVVGEAFHFEFGVVLVLVVVCLLLVDEDPDGALEDDVEVLADFAVVEDCGPGGQGVWLEFLEEAEELVGGDVGEDLVPREGLDQDVVFG